MNQGIGYDITAVMDYAADTGLFSSVCTIQAWNEAVGASGQPTGVYANVTGLILIPCQAMPLSARERKALGEETSIAMLHVLLNGLYAGIVEKQRAVIDGVVYDIVAVDQDSQGQMTTMDVRLATV